MLKTLWLILLLPLLTVASPTTTAPVVGDCSIFPADNIWNTPIDSLPLHPRSQEYIEAVGKNSLVHPDFGSGLWEGGPIGIPFELVSSTQPEVNILYTAYGDESDPGPFPIPDNAAIEGGENADGDRHVIILQQKKCLLFELYRAVPSDDGWMAESGAFYDLKSHQLRPQGWTSADAAGLPIFPGLVRYDEVQTGEIRHALRMTAPETQSAYLWPARHYASDLSDLRYPPMGARFRLRADFPVSRYSPQIQVILRAMQRYGLNLADNGSPWYISGAPDERWDNDVLRELRQLSGEDFEAVDASSLQRDPDSGQVN